MTDEIDADALLDRVGFDPDASVLTRRQATVLVLRERGLQQSVIADRLGTSRANVANIEANARTNLQKARETVSFAEALRAPIQVTVEAGTDLYDVPDAVYAAADEADVTVEHTAPDLMKRVLDTADDRIDERVVTAPLVVSVARDGQVTVREGTPDGEPSR